MEKNREKGRAREWIGNYLEAGDERKTSILHYLLSISFSSLVSNSNIIEVVAIQTSNLSFNSLVA